MLDGILAAVYLRSWHFLCKSETFFFGDNHWIQFFFLRLADMEETLTFLFVFSPSSKISSILNLRALKRRKNKKAKDKMLWILKISGCFVAAMIMIVFSPSLQSLPPAEAIRSSHFEEYRNQNRFTYRKAPSFYNAQGCISCNDNSSSTVCDPSLVHIAITLDGDYLRGSIAAVHSILQHTHCPENIFFHFIVIESDFERLIRSVFPQIKFKIYFLNPKLVKNLISASVRQALEQPLNYARNYLSDLLEPCVNRVIYLDSDIIVIDDVMKLWSTNLKSRTIGAPEYCHANFTKYFTNGFWNENRFAGTFTGRKPCYFNTGVMVMDLNQWRRFDYTRKIERWMEIQKIDRIYELGSLPPFLLVFAGHVAPIEHRWNQHGLGGDNIKGSCRDLHPGHVSLLHWSGSGKPWTRIDNRRPCPLDALWAPYDLYDQLS